MCDDGCQFLDAWLVTPDARELQQQQQQQGDQQAVQEARRHFMALSTRRDTAEASASASATALMARLLELFPQLATEAMDESTGNTALHNAVRFGFADRVSMLVAKGADVTAVNKVLFTFIKLSFFNTFSSHSCRCYL